MSPLSSVAVTVRQPAVRAGAAYALVAPLFVALGGASSAVEVRLRVVGVAAALVPALLWEDRCCELAAATPTGLPAVRRDRLLLVLALVVLGWGSAALLARPDVAARALAVEAAGLVALLLAVVGLLASHRQQERVAAYPVPALIAVLVVLQRLPERWTLLAGAPGGPQWPAVEQRWLAVLAVSALVVAWSARDPAVPGLPRLRAG